MPKNWTRQSKGIHTDVHVNMATVTLDHTICLYVLYKTYH